MTDADNRRSYTLVDDEWFKSVISCFEGVSPEGDWPTLNCQFQMEAKPCMQKMTNRNVNFWFG